MELKYEHNYGKMHKVVIECKSQKKVDQTIGKENKTQLDGSQSQGS